MKNIKYWFAVVGTLLFSLPSFAYDFEVDGVFYKINSGTDCSVTYERYENSIYYSSYSGNITIPSSVEHNGVEYSVKSIGNHAFEGCSELTGITLPADIRIYQEAFINCINLTSIIIPNSDSQYGRCYIMQFAFQNCKSLTSIVLPNNANSVSSWAFEGCSSLVNIFVDEGNKYYTAENGVLYNKEKTTILRFPAGKEDASFQIPASVKEIDDYAFSDCKNLGSIELPENLVSIGARAFNGCIGLTSIDIPNGVKTIGTHSFSLCSALSSIVIPNSVTSIEGGAFLDCTNLKSAVLPNTLLAISNSLFQGCSQLNSIEIPNTVTSIGSFAFSFCKGFSVINIPSSVTSIGEYAFAYCNNLKKIVCNSTTPPEAGSYALSGISTDKCELIVPTEAFNTYKTTEPWSNFKKIKPNTDAVFTVYNGDSNEIFATSLSDASAQATASNALIFAYSQDEDEELPKNVISNNKATSIVLTDAEPFYCPDTVYADKIVYNRTFGYDFWQPLYVPFTSAYSEWSDKAEIAYLSNVHQYDKDGDGEIDKTVIEFFTLKGDEKVRANTPYLIKPKTKGENSFNFAKKVLVPMSNSTGKVTCSSTTKVYTIIGNYQPMTDLTSYIVNTDGLFSPMASDAKLPPFRIRLDESKVSYGTRAAVHPQPIYISVNGVEQITTGIDFIMEDDKSDSYFDLQGRPLANPNGRGLIIRNGKIMINK